MILHPTVKDGVEATKEIGEAEQSVKEICLGCASDDDWDHSPQRLGDHHCSDSRAT